MKFWTADTHFGHERILKLTTRPFSTIEEHDAYLIDRINTAVGRDDQFIICGDFCKKDPQKYRMRIRCRHVVLIQGNHDKRSWYNVFSQSEPLLGKMYKVRDLKIWASHYPHAYWPGSHNGASHVYGHTHDVREETLDQLLPGRRSHDIGVDAARRVYGDFRPFDEDWLYDHFTKETGHDHLAFYHREDHRRKHWQVDSENQVIQGPPTLDTRPAKKQEVQSWMRNRFNLP